MRDRVALLLTTVVAAVHLAVANRYDLFRDELYFIVCGRHPAFGYADQPPLVPLLAAAGYALGGQTWIVRLPAVFAAAALVFVVVRFVRLLGGRDGAAWTAGIAAGFAPVILGGSATFNTTTFEPLAWTLVAYGIARAALADDRRALVWAGLVAGLAMEAKYALPLWLVALALGLACFSERRIFRMRELWIGLAIAFVVALPSVVWQAANGWPFVELVRAAKDKDVAVGPLSYVINQVLILNPLFAPFWIAGLAAPFVRADLRRSRFLAVAFVFTAIVTIAAHGKDYYLAPAYPALFAIGGVAIERFVTNAFVRAAYLSVATVASFALAPLALPILEPHALAAYEQAIHLAPKPEERGDDTETIPSLFEDMLGWHDFVREITAAYDAIPPAERAHTSILVGNYGEAAALDVYGAAYGLPPALSGHNQYYYWGQRGQIPQNVLRVQYHVERLRPYCASMRVDGVTTAAFARDFEQGQTIAYCRGLHPTLREIWPSLKMIL